VIFGAKNEKILLELGQLELQLEDYKTTHAEVETGVERVAPLREPKSRADRKPLPGHLPREVVTHAPEGDCCSDCGG
jgi:transposase